MSDAVIVDELPKQNVAEVTPQDTAKQEERNSIARLKHAVSKAHPRYVLEYFSKEKSRNVQNARVFAGLLALIKEHGVDVATFAVPLAIAMIPMMLGASDTITGLAQEVSLGATGAFLGQDIGETSRSLQGGKTPSSKKNQLKNAAIGSATMMGVGHAAHHIGGDYARATLAGADDFIAPPVILGAIAFKKFFGKSPEQIKVKPIQTIKVSEKA